jgi:hypothetical protein
MARQKKPENETPQAAADRRIREYVSNAATRSEKTSWGRKMDNMVRLLASLDPIEQRILEISSKEKQPVLDEIQQLRQSMVQECVHPFDQLVVKENHVECKFCTKRIRRPPDAIFDPS